MGLPSTKPRRLIAIIPTTFPLSLLQCLQKVLLIDVEFRRHMTGIGLARQRLEWPKIRAVDLLALHQADMLQPRR